MRHTSVFPTRRLSRTLRGTSALPAGLLAHSLIAPDIQAAIGGCRPDPVVTLSNEATLDLSTVVSDSYDDVQKDIFPFSADEPSNTSTIGSKVTTLMPQIPVTATTDLVNVSATLLSTASASGQSPQTLWMNVSG